MIVSIVFLIVTFIIYALIPELRNLHGKCLMCYVVALALLFGFLSTVQLDKSLFLIGSRNCTLVGYLLYFSVILSFTWLTIMCYDIFRTYKEGITAKYRGEESKIFSIYCILGLCIPSFLTLIVFLIDTTHILHEKYLPKFGVKRCWTVDSKLIEAIYVYTPISVMMLINIALFLHTANKIRHAKKSTVDGAQHSRNISAKYRYVVWSILLMLSSIIFFHPPQILYLRSIILFDGDFLVHGIDFMDFRQRSCLLCYWFHQLPSRSFDLLNLRNEIKNKKISHQKVAIHWILIDFVIIFLIN